jgi:diaminopropionate ammonia-lyase
MARLCGAPARVFVPAVTEPATRAAIAGEGADVVQVAGDYDDAVAAARQWAEGQLIICHRPICLPSRRDISFPDWAVSGMHAQRREAGNGRVG